MSIIKVNTRGGGGGKAPTQQIFDTAGTHTYTKPSGCSKVKVTVIGAGGGGGGFRAFVTQTYWVNAGGGGGAGGTAIKLIDGANVGATETVTVGAGGTGGSGYYTYGGGTAAQGGGASSFGSHCTASGGTGGGYTGTDGTGGNYSNQHRIGIHGGGGVGTNGDINLRGGSGEKALQSHSSTVSTNTINPTLSIYSGGLIGKNAKHMFHQDGGVSSIQGGNTVPYGDSGGGHSIGTGGSGSGFGANGANGQGYGNGGQGALNLSPSGGSFTYPSQTGGNGSAGVVIVEEFYG